MKNIIIGIAIAVSSLSVGNGNYNASAKSRNSIKKSQIKYEINIPSETISSLVAAINTVSIKEIVSSYLQIKNALAEDNSAGAATAGKKLVAAFKNFNKSGLTTDQKKTFDEVESDANENAEHIGANSGKIAHQREHFELLSKDIYDLVKTFGAGQVLYKDFDSMFNNGKGAFWLSETKEIKNPYMGKAMLTSGSIKEEIK
jgi:hypothetical protein